MPCGCILAACRCAVVGPHTDHVCLCGGSWTWMPNGHTTILRIPLDFGWIGYLERLLRGFTYIPEEVAVHLPRPVIVRGRPPRIPPPDIPPGGILYVPDEVEWPDA